MKPQARVLQIARRKGMFRLSEATAAGVHPEHIRRLTRTGQLQRLGRGLYALPSLEPSEHHSLAEIAKRVPKGVFCLLTALRFHGLGTQNPREVWLAVDRGARASRGWTSRPSGQSAFLARRCPAGVADPAVA